MKCGAPKGGPEKIRVACVGDSITYGYRGVWAHASEHAYPTVLQRLLGDSYEVRNLGKPSQTMSKTGMDGESRSAYWDCEHFEELSKGGWDIVVIMLGTNDTKMKSSGDPNDNWHEVPGDAHAVLAGQLRASGATYASSYAAMLAYVRTLTPSPTVFMCVPPPSLEHGSYGTTQRLINDVMPPLVPLIASTSGIPASRVIDVHGALGGRALERRFFYDETWGDGVHPCDAGLEAIAEAVFAAIVADRAAAAAQTCALL